MVFYLSELFCYINFFVFLYNYNNGLHILSQETKQRRNKTNSQTMIGQFYVFLTETFYILFLYVTFLPGIDSILPEVKDVGAFVKTFEFGILSMVHCLLIPDLRIKCFVCLSNKFKL